MFCTATIKFYAPLAKKPRTTQTKPTTKLGLCSSHLVNQILSFRLCDFHISKLGVKICLSEGTQIRHFFLSELDDVTTLISLTQES